MPDVAKLTVVPKMRCCRFDENSDSAICGAIASWKTPSEASSTIAFSCDAHRRPDDVPIDGLVLFQRVSFQLEVQFAGVSPIAAMAQAEALARLEAAVESAGGLLGIKAASSTVGLGEAPPPSGGARKGLGRGL